MRLLIILTFLSAAIYGGTLRTTYCQNDECDHFNDICNTKHDEVSYDGICRNGAIYECANGKDMTYTLYLDRDCNGQPYSMMQSGKCYQDGEGGSYSYDYCWDNSLGAEADQYAVVEQEKYDTSVWVWGVIIAAAVLCFVFSAGAFGGYLFHKKGCCMNKSMENRQLYWIRKIPMQSYPQPP